MKLFVPTMDATLVEVDATSGRVRFDGEDWTRPSLQERRAILHAAQDALAEQPDDELERLVRAGKKQACRSQA
jgi:acyl-CoA reductase-like NAD-dependent aldehyde dehydrogenase